MTVTAQVPEAIDLSHHLSESATNRISSPMKALYKYFSRPGIAMLAGGLPSPDYFPFESLSAKVLLPTAYSPLNPTGTATASLDVPKWDENPDKFQLSSALQYTTAAGLPELEKFAQAFTALVFQPGFKFGTIINAGSTDAWSKICIMLCEKGDGIMCEGYTFPSTLAAAWPSGIRPVPLPMDGGGLTVDGMESLLANWKPEEHGGMKRPRVLYTIPVCQNPTGSTMVASRKQAIYDLCVKYDVIIVEDDPYYFLQAGEYKSPSERASEAAPTTEESDEEFIASLIPSYLKFDYQGRVIRIDTYSKTIAPGARLGWTTCNPLFVDRLLRANETTIQAACGYLTWLKGLKAEYRDRRDFIVDAIASPDGADAALEVRGEAALETDKLLTSVAPDGGMFVWIRVRTSTHPSYPRVSAAALVDALFEELADASVLVAPGTMFASSTFGLENPPEEVIAELGGDAFFRIAFATAPKAVLASSMTVIGKVVKEFWGKKF